MSDTNENIIPLRRIKFAYATDPTGQGFFWPASLHKRREWETIKRNRPVEAESVYQCNPGARQGDIFLERDFHFYMAPEGLEFGRRLPEVQTFIKSGEFIIQGWDTALSADSKADWTVGITGLLVPCDQYHRAQDHEDASILGPCDTHYDVYVIDVFREKLDLADAVAAVRSQYMKWHPDLVVIEKKASGAPIIQALAPNGIPLEAMIPLENKKDRIINARGMASVQSWFRQRRVLFPVNAPWTAALKREVKDFTGEKGATDDQVDALAHVIHNAIQRSGIAIKFPTDWQDPRRTDVLMRQVQGNAVTDLFNTENLDPKNLRDMGIIEDPFHNTCGRCTNRDEKTGLCAVLKFRVTKLTPACDSFDSADGLNYISAMG